MVCCGDLGTPLIWASVGGALWLLQPLGTEAGLWPARFISRLAWVSRSPPYTCTRRGRHGWAGVANFGAALSVEQVILPLPLLAWLVASPGERRRALATSGTVAAVVIASFLLWPGDNPRLRAGL